MFAEVSRPAAGVALVTLNRPERLNALSMAVTEDLIAALAGIARDDTVGAVVLTGAGRGFCAGGDIKEMHANREKTIEQRRRDLARMHEIPALLRAMPQVTISAVNGPAYGAGFAVALTCDMVLAAAEASFGTAFLKQGLASDFGLSYQLVRLAGPLAARRMIYLDEVLTSAQARTLNLVTEVVPRDELMARAVTVAAQVARQPAEARTSLKRLLGLAEARAHQEILDEEAAAQLALITSTGHAAAVDNFLAKGPAAPPP